MAKTIAQIKAEAQTIKNATMVGENTAVRVGGAIEDLADYANEVGGTFASGEQVGEVTIFNDLTDLDGKTDAERAKMLPSGRAVEKQSDIEKRMIPSVIHYNGFMKYNGAWYNASNIDSRYTSLIPCAAGDKFLYYGYGGANTQTEPVQITSGSGGISWIFYDANKNRVSSWQLGFIGTYTIEIPQGVAYVQFFGITMSSTGAKPFSVWRDDMVIRLNDKTNINVPSYIKTGGFMKYNGTWSDSSNFDSRFTPLIPCAAGDMFVYTGKANEAYNIPTQITSGSSAVAWIFYDTDKNRVSSWTVGHGTWAVTIPQGVAFAQFFGITRISENVYYFDVWHDVLLAEFVNGNAFKKWLGVKWVAIGDSLTESNLRATKNYHDFITEWTGITVENLGLSGSGYKEKYATNQAFYQRVQTQIDADADVITIFGSGNDLHLTDGVPKYTIGNVDDVGTETICGCINTTLDWLQSNLPLTPLGIISMTPWASTSVPTVYQDEYVAKIAQICVKRGVPYLDLYHASNLHPNSAQFKNVAYRRDGTYSLSAEGVDGAIQVTEDNVSIIRSFGVPNAQIGDWVLPNLTGVHPDEKGHEFFAPRIMSFLESLIMK